MPLFLQYVYKYRLSRKSQFFFVKLVVDSKSTQKPFIFKRGTD